MAKARGHYERVIVACAFLLLFVNLGFTSAGFSVYQSYLVEMPGVGNVGASVVVTIRTFVSLVCLFLTGVYLKKVSPRIGFFLATLSTAASFLAFGLADGMPLLCIASVLAGAGYGLGGMVASSYLTGKWFHGKVGSVSGIVTMGSGVAAIVIPVIAGAIIEATSLAVAFFVESAIALAIAIVILVLVRATPQEMGLEPVTGGLSAGKPSKKAAKPAHPRKHPKVKLAEVPLPKGSRIAIIVATVLLGGISIAGYNYFGVLLTTQGIDPVTAAGLISLAGVFLTVSKFAAGAVCDKLGTLIGTSIFFGLLILAMVLCSLIGNGGVPEAALAAVVLGIGMPLGTTGVSLWSLELSTSEQMLKVVRMFQVAYAFGGFAFNMMPGVLANVTGGYTVSYVVLTVLSVVCAAMVITVYAHHVLRAQHAWHEQHSEG